MNLIHELQSEIEPEDHATCPNHGRVGPRYSPIDKPCLDPGTRIGHVHLKVADLERALQFYCEVLGFELQQRFGTQAAFVSAGGGKVRAVPGVASPGNVQTLPDPVQAGQEIRAVFNALGGN